MARETLGTLAQTTLSAAITSTSATSISVSSAAIPFPQSGNFRIYVQPSGGGAGELMLVTAGQGTTTWTVTRGIENTSAATFSIGALVTQVLTGVGFYGSMPGVSSGTAQLGSAYTVTTSFANVGLSVTLPEAGTYLLQGVQRSAVSLQGSSVNQYALFISQLYDSTNSVTLTNSQVIAMQAEVQVTGVTLNFGATCPIPPVIYTVTGSATINLQAKYSTTGTVIAPTINSDSNGGTILAYTRLY